MDLNNLYAVLAFLGTTLEMRSALTGLFGQRKGHALGEPTTTAAGYASRSRQHLITESRQPRPQPGCGLTVGGEHG